MFARIMAVVLAAILITTVGLSAVWWVSLRNQQVDARLDKLITEAQDIAYLASNLSVTTFDSFWGGTNTRTYLNRKAEQVYQEFGAYIAVVDSAGNVMTNFQTAWSEDPDFVSSLSGEEISNALQTVRSGETIRIRSSVGDAPTFTVGVPFQQNGYVTGAVFIQTKAQRIESGLNELLVKIGLLAGGIILLSGVALFFFVRSALKPLRQLTLAAGAIAEGDFSVQVDESRGDRQLREVGRAFNTMARRLQGVEEGRREFVANVSHELRSPITSIRGFAEGLADGVIPEDEVPKVLELIARESRRMSTLIDDLLALSRLERDDARLDWTVFDINEMLRRAIIRRMTDLDGKRIDVSCELAEDPCLVRADSDRIEQVVINLLDNAVKFTPEEGRIVLASEVRGDTVEVTVRDNGVGIPPEDRDRVFDRFFTADRAHTSGKGTGLGLSICQRIMEMHGQSIRLLESSEGAAFRFTLSSAGKSLPAAGEPAAAEPPSLPDAT